MFSVLMLSWRDLLQAGASYCMNIYDKDKACVIWKSMFLKISISIYLFLEDTEDACDYFTCSWTLSIYLLMNVLTNIYVCFHVLSLASVTDYSVLSVLHETNLEGTWKQHMRVYSKDQFGARRPTHTCVLINFEQVLTLSQNQIRSVALKLVLRKIKIA